MNEGLKMLSEEYFTERLKKIMEKDVEAIEPTEEIRINAGRSIAVMKKSGLYFISENGECVKREKDAAVLDQAEVKELLNMLCERSVYSFQDRIRQGYVTLKGGHRAGVCGRCVIEDGKVKYIADVSGINIRIAHEVKGAAKDVLPIVTKGGLKNTLIISPPGCGKTTMLRDISRVLGGEMFMYRVGLLDERGELSASVGGVPGNDVGCLTAIMENSPKAEGIINMIRSMSPDVIITDEIGSLEDAKAIKKAISCGTKVICTAHGRSVNDVYKRESLRRLIDDGVFDIFVTLSRRRGPGTVESITGEYNGA